MVLATKVEKRQADLMEDLKLAVILVVSFGVLVS